VSASVGEATRLAAAAIVAAEAANAGSSAARQAGEAVALDVARGLGGTAKGALTTTGFPEYGTTLWRVGTVSEIAAEMAAGYGGGVVPYVASSSVAGSSGLVYALTEGLKFSVPSALEQTVSLFSNWTLGEGKSATKWAGQMERRGWTPNQIDEALVSGQKFPAQNNLNSANGATRYVHPETGRSVVIDNKTGQVIHVGGDGFKY
jgi:hypothetical protein